MFFTIVSRTLVISTSLYFSGSHWRGHFWTGGHAGSVGLGLQHRPVQIPRAVAAGARAVVVLQDVQILEVLNLNKLFLHSEVNFGLTIWLCCFLDAILILEILFTCVYNVASPFRYFFYKNFAFTLCHFWYAFFCGFSAQVRTAIFA